MSEQSVQCRLIMTAPTGAAPTVLVAHPASAPGWHGRVLPPAGKADEMLEADTLAIRTDKGDHPFRLLRDKRGGFPIEGDGPSPT